MNQNNVEEMLSEAIGLAKAGERAPAAGLIKQILNYEPNNITALLWSAYLNDDINQIESILKRVLELDPNNTKAIEWQALIRQRQFLDGPKPSVRVMRPTTGPLVSYQPQPTIPKTAQSAPLANVGDPAATLNYGQWQQNITNPNPPSYLSQQRPLPIAPEYNIREINQPLPQPVQVVIQMPETRQTNQTAPAWLIALLVVLVIAVIGGIVFVVLGQNGSINAIGKPDKSVYRGFDSVDELMTANLVSHERVDLVIPFDGGYSVSADGYIRIDKPTKNGTLVINWNTKEIPLTGFHSSQFVRVYGTVEGINNTITLNVEQVALERG